MIKILIIAIFTFIIDIFSKTLVQDNLILYKSVSIIDNFFYLTYTNNYGAAFSILKNNQTLLIIVAFIAIIGLFIHLKKQNNIKIIEVISYGLLIGGIIGNLYDRVVYGYVRDFLDFYIFGYDFAIFNLADTAIVIAIILLIIDSLVGGVKNEDNNSRTDGR